MDTDHSPPRRRWLSPGVALVALAVGLVAGGLGIAGAEEKVPDAIEIPKDATIPVPPPFFGGAPVAAPFPGPDVLFWKGFPGRGPRFGFGFGPFGIHSEVTVENPEGKYQTTAAQLGKVVSVNPTSITLESDDGYRRTYAVNEDTVVTAGRDGIDNLKNGDTVHLLAHVEGGEARATQILDAAAMKFELGRAARAKPGS